MSLFGNKNTTKNLIRQVQIFIKNKIIKFFPFFYLSLRPGEPLFNALFVLSLAHNQPPLKLSKRGRGHKDKDRGDLASQLKSALRIDDQDDVLASFLLSVHLFFQRPVAIIKDLGRLQKFFRPLFLLKLLDSNEMVILALYFSRARRAGGTGRTPYNSFKLLANHVHEGRLARTGRRTHDKKKPFFKIT